MADDEPAVMPRVEEFEEFTSTVRLPEVEPSHKTEVNNSNAVTLVVGKLDSEECDDNLRKEEEELVNLDFGFKSDGFSDVATKASADTNSMNETLGNDWGKEFAFSLDSSLQHDVSLHPEIKDQSDAEPLYAATVVSDVPAISGKQVILDSPNTVTLLVGNAESTVSSMDDLMDTKQKETENSEHVTEAENMDQVESKKLTGVTDDVKEIDEQLQNIDKGEIFEAESSRGFDDLAASQSTLKQDDGSPEELTYTSTFTINPKPRSSSVKIIEVNEELDSDYPEFQRTVSVSTPGNETELSAPTQNSTHVETTEENIESVEPMPLLSFNEEANEKPNLSTMFLERNELSTESSSGINLSAEYQEEPNAFETELDLTNKETDNHLEFKKEILVTSDLLALNDELELASGGNGAHTSTKLDEHEPVEFEIQAFQSAPSFSQAGSNGLETTITFDNDSLSGEPRAASEDSVDQEVPAMTNETLVNNEPFGMEEFESRPLDNEYLETEESSPAPEFTSHSEESLSIGRKLSLLSYLKNY